MNHLLDPSRVLRLGSRVCHKKHLQLLVDSTMKWENAQKILFPKVRNCLEKIGSGEVLPKEKVTGTILYLGMVWKYVKIFYSLSAALKERSINRQEPAC